MAKKYKDRPPINAVSFWIAVSEGKIDAGPIRRSPHWSIRHGAHFKQTWLNRNKKTGEVSVRNAWTYLGQIILAAWWFPVEDWKIEWYKAHDVELRTQGIVKFPEGYRQLYYDQVERFDGSYRQLDYVSKSKRYQTPSNLDEFNAMAEEIERSQRITDKVIDRRGRIESAIKSIVRELNGYRCSLPNFLKSDAFRKNDQKDQLRIAREFRKIAEELRKPDFRIRPISPKLLLSAKQLDRAADALSAGDIETARHLVELAARKIVYEPVFEKKKEEQITSE